MNFFAPYPNDFKTWGIVLEIIYSHEEPVEPDLSTIKIKYGGSGLG